MAARKPRRKLAAKIAKAALFPLKAGMAVGRGLKNVHNNLGKTKAGDFARRTIYTGALLAALHATPPTLDAYHRWQADRLNPAPPGIVRMVSESYSPYSVVLPHPNTMSYSIPDPFKFTYVNNASRLVNEEINSLVDKYRKDPRYRLAAKHINAAFIHGMISAESRYHPGAYFPSNNKSPTDAGLGQVTLLGLNQARDDGAVPKNVKRVEELMTLPHPDDFKIEKNERSYYNPNRKLLQAIYDREIGLLGKTPGQLTREEVGAVNEERIRNNLRASVHVAFSNAQGFLQRIQAKTNPKADLKRFIYLSYKDGGAGTAKEYLAEGKNIPGVTRIGRKSAQTSHDKSYTSLRGFETEQAAKNLRFVMPPQKDSRLPLPANAIALAPWLGFRRKWAKQVKKASKPTKAKGK
jgi:hypothetical protein